MREPISPVVGASGSTRPGRLMATAMISVVIPCFNEEDVLPLLFDRLDAAARSWGVDYEVILVDDGSKDQTWQLIADKHRQDQRWKGVRLARNFGHQIALWTGLQHVAGQIIAVLDADLQDPPEVLPRFFAQWQDGYDVIYGVRRKRKERALKRLAYFAYYRILRSLSEIEIPLDSGDFCVIDRRVLDAMLQSREQVPFVRGLRAWVGFRQTALEYERDARAAGEVKYTFRKLMSLGINGIFSFSTRPLRLATYLGFVVSATSFLGIFFVIIQRLFSDFFVRLGLPLVPGFATTATVMLFLGGVQLFCVGILGEYIGRIYENVKGRPLTVIGEKIGIDAQVNTTHRPNC